VHGHCLQRRLKSSPSCTVLFPPADLGSFPLAEFYQSRRERHSPGVAKETSAPLAAEVVFGPFFFFDILGSREQPVSQITSHKSQVRSHKLVLAPGATCCGSFWLLAGIRNGRLYCTDATFGFWQGSESGRLYCTGATFGFRQGSESGRLYGGSFWLPAGIRKRQTVLWQLLASGRDQKAADGACTVLMPHDTVSPQPPRCTLGTPCSGRWRLLAELG